MNKSVLLFCASALLFCGCGNNASQKQTLTASGLVPAKFVTTLDEGRKTQLYTLKNANGMEVCVTNIGGRIVSIWVPDRNGGFRDVALGFDNIEQYKPINTNFGAIIGRYGNRIAGAHFLLSNRANFKLRANDPGDSPKNTLHGGPRGFHTQYFNIEQTDSASLVCTYISKNNEEGFPGDLKATVTYSLSADNALTIDYQAVCNQVTVCNLTNHSYFNLSGDPEKPILDHILYINAKAYTPTDVELIPTGKIESVEGTPLDFNTPTAIGDRIDDTAFEAIRFGKGYDHNFVLDTDGEISVPAAKVVCPSSGIAMEVYTIEPGLQFYSGNFLDGSQTGKRGIAYQHRTALCLETQHYPNSPNIKSFPSTELLPGDIYHTKTIYKFGVEK